MADNPSSQVLARRPHPSTHAVAWALAHAFLAAPTWTPDDLTTAGATVLGVRRRWLGPLVRNLLAVYPRPPATAPRQLAASIAASAPFSEAVQRATAQRVPLTVSRYLPEQTEADATRDSHPPLTVPELATVLGLSLGELQWFADTGRWNRRTRPGRLHHYQYVWRTRPGRVPRLLEIPQQRLRRVQRDTLDHLLVPVRTHNAAHGFVAGRSALSGAAEHSGSDTVLSLDLTSFFSAVSAGAVFGALRTVGFSETVAHSVAGLSTHSVPPWILSAMPAGGSPSERFALRQKLAIPHLPQGAPTSPALANLTAYRLDARLDGWARSVGATYTRYADDLTFSGTADLGSRATAFIRGVTRIVEAEGHTINEHKTRVRRANVRQSVTGVVVNTTTSVPRDDYDRLKAILHNCERWGPHNQNREGHPDFRAHLLGRIGWVRSVNPQRGQRLAESFARIRW